MGVVRAGFGRRIAARLREKDRRHVGGYVSGAMPVDPHVPDGPAPGAQRVRDYPRAGFGQRWEDRL